MPSAPTPVPTFSSPRMAPRPRVIPLFATTVSRPVKRRLAIHEVLRSRPPRVDRAESPRSTSRVHPKREKRKPPPITVMMTAGSSSAAIESPLTPVAENSEPATGEGSSQKVNLQLIPPPHGSVTVINAGWSAQQQHDYRQIGRDAITKFLEVGRCLSNQQPKPRNQARGYIESRIPTFTNHEGHWGADTILRDQLKSMKDTRNKKRTRQTAELDAE
ncbi:hypothetical protein K435DRAFT_853355 [Dendrothele bispora CBS 962.96]|uniref:Uncharacterized protein n=1 Tax=Dendrothele bispora (strain CBS 962.96) TaxID=1314807 RepID=A0A4S8MGY4_DENBC|nr:hypothetical protein K435DRAFT_853355 [Dendrothele bispora CBS 962.96]